MIIEPNINVIIIKNIKAFIFNVDQIFINRVYVFIKKKNEELEKLM